MGSSNPGMNQGTTKVALRKNSLMQNPEHSMESAKHWIEKTKSVFEICECLEESNVKFAACTFVDQALSWWDVHIKAMTLPVANAMPWEELKEMLMVEYCPHGEVQKQEKELWNLTVENSGIEAYISRFSELALLCPGMITSEGKKIKQFIWGLTPPLQGNMIAANLETFDNAKRVAQKLYDLDNEKGTKIAETKAKKEGNN
ncbi:uncharacterized protein LOC111882321 [Lactuca sativa]|uniref:uncharacterized protein LOC111882321 n=1 Tax=Lactuca sativa TaxID=4236 RepID=UPI000CD8B71C|nr:uncharacterized protein LOC111882321 [Lactuca sativa]